MGLLGVALVARSGYSLAALESFIFCALLVAIAFIDIDTFTVPDSLVGLLAVNGLLFGGLRLAVGDLDRDAFYGRLIGAVAAFVVLGAIIVVATGLLRRTRRAAPYFQRFPRIQAYLQARELPQDEWAMGWGDPLIMIGIGAHLGWQLLPITLFLASVQGSIVGMVLLPLGKLKHAAPVAPDDDWIPPAGAVPFGPFLALAALEAAFFSSQLNGWLVQILGLDQF